MSSSTELTEDSNGLKNLPTLAPHVEEPGLKRRRFSQDTINDLLFWGCHLCVVAIALAIVWTKLDKNTEVLRRVLDAQAGEMATLERQLKALEEQRALLQAQGKEREQELRDAHATLANMLTGVGKIQSDITQTLDRTKAISESVLVISGSILDLTAQSKSAAVHAANAAQLAAGAASSAAGAANRAANTTITTKQLVGSKVVTSADKVRIQREQAALAVKRQQLTKEIKKVKKTGPTWVQRMFQ
jgi:chromosome segregation ATPase